MTWLIYFWHIIYYFSPNWCIFAFHSCWKTNPCVYSKMTMPRFIGPILWKCGSVSIKNNFPEWIVHHSVLSVTLLKVFRMCWSQHYRVVQLSHHGQKLMQLLDRQSKKILQCDLFYLDRQCILLYTLPYKSLRSVSLQCPPMLLLFDHNIVTTAVYYYNLKWLIFKNTF